MYKEHFQKSVDEETKWEEEEAAWIKAFHKTERYRQLLEQYNPDSVEKAVVRMAQTRTRVYRKGPAKLRAEELNKRKEVLPQTYLFFKALLKKKWFDLQIKWNAGRIELDGIHFPNQFGFFGDPYIYTHPLVWQITPAEIEFLRHLLQDEEFIRNQEDLSWWLIIEQEGDLRQWQKTRKDDEVYPPDHYLFSNKYDEWFGQQHLLLLPQTRLDKYDHYMDVLQKALRPEQQPWVDPDEGKYYFEDGQEEKLVSEWFRKHEKAEMNAWYEATWQVVIRKKATDSTEFYEAMDALIAHPVKVYPDGSLRWDQALICAGKTLAYKAVSDCLEYALQQYETGVRKGKNPLLLEKCRKGMEKEWVDRVYKEDVEELFQAQALLNEPQTLRY